MDMALLSGGTSGHRVHMTNPEDINLEAMRKPRNSSKAYRKLITRKARRGDRVAISRGEYEYIHEADYRF